MYNIYSIEFLDWLNRWLYRGKLNNKIKLFNELCNNFIIPQKYKQCDNELYRCSDFLNGVKNHNDRNLIYAYFWDDLHINISSWSYDFNIAKKFHKELLKQQDGLNYIVKYRPKNNEIYLNIDLLCRNKVFWNYLHQNKKKVHKYKEGLSRYLRKKYYQKEVILNIKTRISCKNIIAIGYNFPNSKLGFINRNYEVINYICKKTDKIGIENVKAFLLKEWDDNYWKEDISTPNLFINTCEFVILRQSYPFNNKFIQEKKNKIIEESCKNIFKECTLKCWGWMKKQENF